MGHMVFLNVKWTLKCFFLPPLNWCFEAIIRGAGTFGEVQRFKHGQNAIALYLPPPLPSALFSRGQAGQENMDI